MFSEDDEKIRKASMDPELDKAINRLFTFVFTSISTLIVLAWYFDNEL